MSCAMRSRSVVSNSLQPPGLQPARFLCPWGFSRQEHWNALPYPPPGNLPNPGIKPRSPTLQVDFLPSEPTNTGVDILSLLQGIFPTQESNWGLLHCRQILYQLSYQGSQLLYKIIILKIMYLSFGLASGAWSLYNPHCRLCSTPCPISGIS